MNKLVVFFTLTVILISNFCSAISKGIKEIYNPTLGLYSGPRPLTLDEIKMLKSRGIKSILNLQGGDVLNKYWKMFSWNEPGEKTEIIQAERFVANSINLNFLNIPLNSLDPVTNDENTMIDQALEFMHNKDNQPVYVHCEHGIDRTGMMIALYKVKYENVKPNAAYDEWYRLGHDKKRQILTGDLDDYFFEKVKEFKK